MTPATTSSKLATAKHPLPAVQDEPLSNEQWKVALRGGTRALIRPIRKEDRELERRFIEALSPRSRRLRFLDTFRSPSPELLKLLVEIDSSRDVALIAVIAGKTGDTEIGVARLCGALDGRSCEFAIVVSDEWQRKGLGTHLMQRLAARAASRGLQSMYSIDVGNNDLMRGFAAHLGMHRKVDPNDSTQVIHSVDLKTFDNALTEPDAVRLAGHGPA